MWKTKQAIAARLKAPADSQYFCDLAGSSETGHLPGYAWEKLPVAVMGRHQCVPEGATQSLRVKDPPIFSPDRRGGGQPRLAQQRRGGNGYHPGHVGGGHTGPRFQGPGWDGEQEPGQVRQRAGSARRAARRTISTGCGEPAQGEGRTAGPADDQLGPRVVVAQVAGPVGRNCELRRDRARRAAWRGKYGGQVIWRPRWGSGHAHLYRRRFLAWGHAQPQLERRVCHRRSNISAVPRPATTRPKLSFS